MPEPGEGARLGREFYETDAATLAPRLIGCELVRVLEDGTRLSGRIVETEAYLGVRDRASHAFGGRRTARNEMMYARAGTAYVYFTYGMHFCMNVVCGGVDEPTAVLLRALEPVGGLEEMRAARATAGRPTPRDVDLCSGPGKLCRAMRIGRAENGLDLVESGAMWIEAVGAGWRRARLVRSSRIGLGESGAWKKRLLRWHAAGNAHVSA